MYFMVHNTHTHTHVHIKVFKVRVRNSFLFFFLFVSKLPFHFLTTAVVSADNGAGKNGKNNFHLLQLDPPRLQVLVSEPG